MLGGWKLSILDVRIPADSQFATVPAGKRRRSHSSFTGRNSAESSFAFLGLPIRACITIL
jgi:hypothetical protein